MLLLVLVDRTEILQRQYAEKQLTIHPTFDGCHCSTKLFILLLFLNNYTILGYSMKLILYQTLNDKENPDHVANHGPFPCNRKNAWLGEGFYFWDAHIQLAHWWGEVNFANRIYKNGYIVCQADAVLDQHCWDLHGDGLARLELKKICDLLIDTQMTTYDDILVNHVIEYLKKIKEFKYKSIRALSMKTVSPKRFSDYVLRIAFDRRLEEQVLDIYPPVQICLVEKTALSLRNFRIIYPTEYIDNFA